LTIQKTTLNGGHSGKDGVMGLEGEADEKAQDLFTFPPVTWEGLGCPASLGHHDPQVDTQQEKVHSFSNWEAVTQC